MLAYGQDPGVAAGEHSHDRLGASGRTVAGDRCEGAAVGSRQDGASAGVGVPVTQVLKTSAGFLVAPGELGALPVAVRGEAVLAVLGTGTGSDRVGDNDLPWAVPVTEEQSACFLRRPLVGVGDEPV